MSGQSCKPDDLRFATNEERRFALAYLRWLAGGEGRRGSQPQATHPTYALTPERGQQIRDAGEQLRKSRRRATPPAAERSASSAGAVDHGAPEAAEAGGQQLQIVSD